MMKEKPMLSALIAMAAALEGFDAMASGRSRGIDPASINAGSDFNKHTPKGLHEFTIDGYTVYAINYKNALRKVDKLKSLA